MSAPDERPVEILQRIHGIVRDGVTILVTPSGTELPIGPGCEVSVMEVVHAIAWIDGLPEITARGFVW